MSSSTDAPTLPDPRRITASNLPIPAQGAKDGLGEPGVEVKVETLAMESVFNGVFRRSTAGTSKQFPVSNDGHGNIPLDEVPGMGIVLPGGMHFYYLDIAPHSEGVLHRTTTTDYLVVISGKLSLDTPKADAYEIKDGKPSSGKSVETVAVPGDVVVQRGMMHALSNRTDEWVRLLAVVLASEPNKVPVEGSGDFYALEDAWLG